MSYEIRVRLEAENDILEAALWYNDQLQNLGRDFLKVVQDEFSNLEKYPMMFPIVYKDVYRILIKRFPFGIFYRIDGALVIIIAVLHASRDPVKWKER